MKILVSEKLDAIINSENFEKAEIVSDVTTIDVASEKFRYAIDVWTKDGSVYRLGTYDTKDTAKGMLAYLLVNLTCDNMDILQLSQDSGLPKPLFPSSEKVLK